MPKDNATNKTTGVGAPEPLVKGIKPSSDELNEEALQKVSGGRKAGETPKE